MASNLTRVEIQSGNNSSFWFDNRSSLGRLIDLTGPCGCIDMGININAMLGMLSTLIPLDGVEVSI